MKKLIILCMNTDGMLISYTENAQISSVGDGGESEG